MNQAVDVGDLAHWHADDPDLELMLPKQPKLNSDCDIVISGVDDVLINNGACVYRIRGTEARSMMRSVVPHFTGTMSVEDICARVSGVTGEQVRAFVTLLAHCGVLEDGGNDISDQTPISLRKFVSAAMSQSRWHRERTEAIDYIASRRVLLAGYPEVCKRIVAILESVGMQAQLTSTQQVMLSATEPCVVVAVAGFGHDVRAELDAAWKLGHPAIHFALGTDEAHVGPLLWPMRTASYDCYVRARNELAGAPDEFALKYWSAWFAQLLILFCGRLAEPHIVNAYVRHFLDGRESQRVSITLTEQAFRGVTSSPEAIAAVQRHPDWAKQCSILKPPRECVSPAVHLVHYQSTSIKLAGASEVYQAPDGSVAIGFDAPLSAVIGNTRRNCVEFELVRLLLHRAAGYVKDQSGRMHRLAPTGGNIGSSEIYLVARSVRGLAPGGYRFSGKTGTLQILRNSAEDFRIDEAFSERHSECAAWFVIVGNQGAVGSKYGDYGFNIIHYDAGVAVEYLRTLMAAHGVRWTECPFFNSEACKLLLRIPRSTQRYEVLTALGVGPAASEHPASNLGWQPEALDEAILQRKAHRRYGAAGIDAYAIHDLLSAMKLADERVRSAGGVQLPLSTLLVIGRPTTQLPAGYYGLSDRDTVELIRPFKQPREGEVLISQSALGRAPYVLATTVDLPAALLRHPQRGYSEALIRAGSLIGAAWLRLGRHGLHGTAAGCLIEGEFRARLEAVLGHRSVLLGMCFGPKPQ